MGRFESSVRDRSLAQDIYGVYATHLQEDIKAIIVCGGAGKPDTHVYQSSDIDYIVVVSRLDAYVAHALSNAQQELSMLHTARPSHTVLIMDELMQLPEYSLSLDGKAVQALIEAEEQDIAGIERSDIPRLTRDEVREFSRQNFFVLKALLRKTLVRSAPTLTTENKIAMAKIALIVQKMYKQALGDHYTDIWEGRDELADLKLHPADYSNHEARAVILKILSLNLQ